MPASTYRVTGLAGEAAFFALLSLPPFVLGLIGVLAKIGTWIGGQQVREIEAWVIDRAGLLFTEDTITSVVQPLLSDVLRDDAGKVSIISLGFLLSLWSGSRALYVYVDLISVAYGLGEERGIIRTRLMSFGLYVVGLVIGIIVMPILVIGPTLLKGAVPGQYGGLIELLYWPVVIVGSVLFLTVLYHVSVPVRTTWWRELPGAILALFLWIVVRRRAAGRAGRLVLARLRLRLAGRAHRGAAVALHHRAGRADRGDPQRRGGPPVRRRRPRPIAAPGRSPCGRGRPPPISSKMTRLAHWVGSTTGERKERRPCAWVFARCQ